MYSSISIRILLTICTIGFTMSAIQAYVSCDKNKQCKFGGRCWPDGKCHCVFNCSPKNWYSGTSQWLCAPKHIQRRPFRNLCELTAQACEIQKAIPIVKIDFSVPRKSRCKVKSDWELCDKPGDFMGTCGGNMALDGNKNAGVCLKEKSSNTTRCQCPNTMSGRGCQAKVLPLMMETKDLDKKLLEEEEFSGRNIAIQLMYSLCAVAVAMTIVILFVKWVKSGKFSIFENKEKIICKDAESFNCCNHSNNNRDGDITIIFENSRKNEILERNNNTESYNKIYKMRKNDFHSTRGVLNSDSSSKHSLEIIVTSPSPSVETKPIL